jgi:N-methylhydantoinase A
LHGAAVGRALGCRRVHVPRLAGAFCALGMLHSSVRHDHMRMHFADLDGPDHAPLDAVFADLEGQARARLKREGFRGADIQIARALDLRYVGQQWEITVPVEGHVDGQRIRCGFDAEHDRLFGHTQPGGQIEIMKARVTGVGRLPSLSHPAPEPACDSAQPFEQRPVWIDPKIGWRETPIYQGAALAPGHVISGPAIIDEQTTTVLVGNNDTLEVGKTGNFDITFGADTTP